MSQNRELVERVFAPGNLVFGGYMTKIQSLIERGIRQQALLEQ